MAAAVPGGSRRNGTAALGRGVRFLSFGRRVAARMAGAGLATPGGQPMGQSARCVHSARSGSAVRVDGELGDVVFQILSAGIVTGLDTTHASPALAGMRVPAVFGAGRVIGAGGPGRWREPRRVR
jgi:hypothetical protein